MERFCFSVFDECTAGWYERKGASVPSNKTLYKAESVDVKMSNSQQ